MFIGREEELRKLDSMYGSGKFEFAVIYGRRRVGKTTLIRQFCKEKRAFYFVARESDGAMNLRVLGSEMAAQGFTRAGTSFDSWDAFFETLRELSISERLLVAVDEYPYLAASTPSISSTFQAYIDGWMKESKLFLILCGSSMSFMEHQILGHQSPLYGRRTAQFKIKPFGFFETRAFLKNAPLDDQVAFYGITGGVPEYVSQIDVNVSLAENVTRLFLSESGPLYEEPVNLMKQELREPAVYNSIIAAVAGGASRLSEIASKTQMESNKTAKYLSALQALGVIKKETPTAEKPGRKSIYVLADNMFRFWYRFVFPNMSAIASGLSELVYEKRIKDSLSQFLGPVFEEICVEYLWQQQKMGKLPLFAGGMGRWWGNNPLLKRQYEIDILAINGDAALLGECKWRNAPVNFDTLNLLRERGAIFTEKQKYYYVFSKSGFTEELLKSAAAAENVRLVTLEDMTGE